jgi:hypothetical protein
LSAPAHSLVCPLTASTYFHQAETGGQMLAMLLQEARSREIHVEPRSLGIVKRGVCTFVQKAHALQNAGANLAIVVNNGM